MQDFKDKDNSKVLMTISIAADILQVHQRTLRIYDAANVLSPSRSEKNRRLYTIEDLNKGKLIRWMTTSLGLNLVGVKLVTSLLDSLDIPLDERTQYIEDIAKEVKITTDNELHQKRRGRTKASSM